MSLNDELKKLELDVLNSLDADVQKLLLSENAKIFSSFLEDKAIRVGSKAPDVYFRDKNLKTILLKDILKEHHVVLNFFRGAWCPYCNLELTALQNINDKIEEKGARLISASPELYKFVEKTIEKNNITTPVFTDLGNAAANEFGLVFKLPQKYREIYSILNIYLNELNGDNSWTLPMPATFIISKDNIITASYINADYTQRMEPDDILAQLDLL